MKGCHPVKKKWHIGLFVRMVWKMKYVKIKTVSTAAWSGLTKKKGRQMGKAQREKGKRGERELAGILRNYGYDTRRGQQFCGADGSADVIGLPGIHIECKRVEKLNLLDAMEQSKEDARPGEFPAVFHRRDRTEWLATMRLDDWINLFREWEAGREVEG